MANIRRSEDAPLARRESEWDPFRSMRELMGWDPFREAFPRLWGRSGGGLFAPAFDVRETKDRYVFQADLPGFRDEDVDISLNGNRLTISGKREAEQVDRSDTYYCSERSHGSFARSFTLPDGVDATSIEAELRDGILSVRVPKVPEAQPRRIELQGKSGGQSSQSQSSQSQGNPRQSGEQGQGRQQGQQGQQPAPQGRQGQGRGEQGGRNRSEPNSGEAGRAGNKPGGTGEFVREGRETDESQVP